MLWRESSNSSWSPIEEENTRIVFEGGKYFVRASIDHFSQGCIAKNIDVRSTHHVEEVSGFFWRPPRRRQLEFVNATTRPLIFLVLPTSCSDRAPFLFHAGASFAEVGVDVEIREAVRQSIFSSAHCAQIMDVSPRTTHGDLQRGERCPYATCIMPDSAGMVGVSLVTMKGTEISVWDYRVVHQRTRVTILPGRFANGMSPMIGIRHLAPGQTSVVGAALGMLREWLEWSEQRAPISTVSSFAPG